MKTNIIEITIEMNDIPKLISETTLSATIWFTGCNNDCKKCHNPYLQKISRDGLSISSLRKSLELRYQLVDWMVLCGGEPLFEENIQYAKELIKIGREIGYNIFIYTGYEFEKIKDFVKENDIDYIKCGKYNEDLENDDYIFASVNQSLYDSDGNKVYYFENGKINNLTERM